MRCNSCGVRNSCEKLPNQRHEQREQTEMIHLLQGVAVDWIFFDISLDVTISRNSKIVLVLTSNVVNG